MDAGAGGVCSCLAGLGWWAAESRARVADVELHDELLQQTMQIAKNINLALARKLAFKASDEGTPAFECLREQLTGYGTEVPNSLRIYCLAERNDHILFGIDIELGGTEKTRQRIKPGDIYKNASDKFLRMFGQKMPFTDGPYADDRGTFVSACVPVYDQQMDKVSMVVGLDVDAGDWIARVNAARRGPILTTLAMMLLLAGGTLWPAGGIGIGIGTR